MKFFKNGGIFVSGIIASLVCLSSCTWWETKKDEKVPFVIVNVLDEKYYKDCHIRGSINVTMECLGEYARKNWSKDTEIVVYCANYKCTASGDSVKMLKDLGFKYVWAYEGGTAEWKQLGYPVAGSPCQAGYLSDFEKPEGHEVDPDVPVISAQELKQKFDTYSF